MAGEVSNAYLPLVRQSLAPPQGIRPQILLCHRSASDSEASNCYAPMGESAGCASCPRAPRAKVDAAMGALDASGHPCDWRRLSRPWIASMPRNAFNSSFLLNPACAPPFFPWKSEDDPDRNTVWDRPVSDDHLRTLQQIAHACKKWATWHEKCDRHSLMLAASIVSIERVGAFIDDVTQKMLFDESCDAKRYVTPGRGDSRLEIKNAKKRFIPHAQLFVCLDAAHSLRAVITGQEEMDFHWNEPDADIPEHSFVWRDGTAYEYGLVARALGLGSTRTITAFRTLPSDIRLMARLRDAARQVCRDLKKTAKAAAAGNSATATKEYRAVARAVVALHVLATAHESHVGQWGKAAAHVHSTMEAWKEQAWTDAHGHNNNQTLRNQLSVDVGYLQQYVLLMRAADRRYRVLWKLKLFIALVLKAGKYAAKIIGPYNKPPAPEISKLFTVDLVEPVYREQWAALPDSLRENAGQVIDIVLKGSEWCPWLVGKHMKSFVRKGLVGGDDAETQRRQLVNKVLVPMQAVGLAAKVRWKDLLAVPPSKPRKSGKCREPDWAARMSKGYHGRLWIVNPFGARLHID